MFLVDISLKITTIDLDCSTRFNFKTKLFNIMENNEESLGLESRLNSKYENQKVSGVEKVIEMIADDILKKPTDAISEYYLVNTLQSFTGIATSRDKWRAFVVRHFNQIMQRAEKRFNDRKQAFENAFRDADEQDDAGIDSEGKGEGVNTQCTPQSSFDLNQLMEELDKAMLEKPVEELGISQSCINVLEAVDVESVHDLLNYETEIGVVNIEWMRPDKVREMNEVLSEALSLDRDLLQTEPKKQQSTL